MLPLQLLGAAPKTLPATIEPANVNDPSPPIPPRPRSVAVLNAIVLFSTTVVLAGSFQLSTAPPRRAVFPVIVLFRIVSAPWWVPSPKFWMPPESPPSASAWLPDTVDRSIEHRPAVVRQPAARARRSRP